MNSTLMPSRLVFGTGGRFGRLQPTLAQFLVDQAWSHGIRTFDTGYHYSSGASQRLLCSCLSKYLLDESLQISTKVKADPYNMIHSIDRTYSMFGGRPLDVVFLWGPSIEQLHDKDTIALMQAYLQSGVVTCFGVNTHDLLVMDSILSSPCSAFLSDVMVDYSLARLESSVFISQFSSSGLRVWAGTALGQGYLIESIFNQFLRTRSLSYLLRAFLSPATRELVAKAAPIRRALHTAYPTLCADLPLSFVLSNPNVNYIPVGMMASSSIKRNIFIESSLCKNEAPLKHLIELFDAG